MARTPIVAGQFYPSEASRLSQQIKDCFLSNFGPGDISTKKGHKEIIGIISPHAGYTFSGSCAAFSYKEISESVFPDVFIMLGLSHNGYPSCLSLEDWQTPFGIIKTDKEFQDELTKSLPIDEEAHAYEHSIEVQLPFLQFVNKDNLAKLKIAPIIASNDIEPDKLALLVANAIKKTKRKTVIIASSDFTHYGLNYGYLPFRANVKENMYKLDRGAIDFIEKLDANGFLAYTEKTGATICGKYPISVLLSLSRKLGAKKAALLKYYTSGDIVGDYNSAVGYASIKIE